ncbi:response regulator [Emticicia sp. CRIBPO]|uniref:response regulator n=1 Tax=Emticicia sp. CRIBPO TaxID=2683258 RepID=UPI001411D6D3|nr:response regulator [Emticicia sp. CRIBPO]NBA89063.1 response regulator [Emticicia sp. CRIBPO]
MQSLDILLIEDNEGDILLTTEALDEAGFIKDIVVIKDGEEAIRYLGSRAVSRKAGFPDLILLDVNLPKKNGHEVLKFIKANKWLRHIPVIMFSTSSADKDVFDSYDNFANCYITKPTDIEDFQGVIESIEHFWMQVARLPNKTEF